MSVQLRMGSPLNLGSLFRAPKKLKAVASLAVGAMATMVRLAAFPGVAEAIDDTITASATNTATFNFAVDNTTAAFGTTLNPNGADSDVPGVVDYQSPGVGSYYAKDTAATATVDSNKAWSGSVAAAANTGTSDMTPADNMRWKLGSMPNLAASSSGATAFSGMADTTVFDAATSCSSGATKLAGACSYTYAYSLASKWINTPVRSAP